MISIIAPLLLFVQSASVPEEPGLFVKALWFVQGFGAPECTLAENDQNVKKLLAKAIAKDRIIHVDEIRGLMSQLTFSKFAGKDNQLSEREINKVIEAATPPSRMRLNSELRKHAELLTTSFDMIEEGHREATQRLAEWISKQSPSQEVNIIVTCTGNSRRSMLGAMMGNLAAAYYGMENVHFHSGGTSPTAFNRRTIASLQEIGFEIKPTGEVSEINDGQSPNPKYRVVWGKEMEAVEFSKRYDDPFNPQSGFAAIMVCNEADAECPIVKGASIRISMPFVDPKLYDDGTLEAAKYRERRDDIGRTFFSAIANARRRMESNR